MTKSELNIENSEKVVFSIFRLHWANARTAIDQLKRGEWEFCYNPLTKHCCVAHRGELELWVGNGAFFCDINGKNAFGFILRHWVWWAAARNGRKLQDAKHWSAQVPFSLNVKCPPTGVTEGRLK